MTKTAEFASADNLLLTPMGFRNKLINGNFDFWQRGFSQTTSGYGSDDRWFNYCAGSSIVHTRESFATDQTAVPNFPRYFSRTVVTSATGANFAAYKEQRIEDVGTLAGKRAVVTFWAKADVARVIAVNFMQRYGLAIQVWMQPVKVTLSTQWQKYAVAINIGPVPSFAGHRGALHLKFFFDAGSALDAFTGSLGHQSGTFDIARVQVEEGVATPFEIRPWGQELALCQRYFEKTYDVDDVPGSLTTIGALTTRQASAQGTPCSFDWRFKVTKYITTALTVKTYNPVAANTLVRCITGVADCEASVESGVSNGSNGAIIYFVTSSGSIAGALNAVHATVEAEV